MHRYTSGELLNIGFFVGLGFGLALLTITVVIAALILGFALLFR